MVLENCNSNSYDLDLRIRALGGLGSLCPKLSYHLHIIASDFTFRKPNRNNQTTRNSLLAGRVFHSPKKWFSGSMLPIKACEPSEPIFNQRTHIQL